MGPEGVEPTTSCAGESSAAPGEHSLQPRVHSYAAGVRCLYEDLVTPLENRAAPLSSACARHPTPTRPHPELPPRRDSVNKREDHHHLASDIPPERPLSSDLRLDQPEYHDNRRERNRDRRKEPGDPLPPGHSSPRSGWRNTNHGATTNTMPQTKIVAARERGRQTNPVAMTTA